MSPAQIRMGAVLAELERDWGIVLKQLERATSVDPVGGEAPAAMVALALDHAYQALEQILLRIERALVLPARTGHTWHRSLLADAARALPGVRPAVIATDAERDWAELLGFRHFLRHAYATELDPTRLRTLAQVLRRAVTLSEPMMQAAFAALDPLLADDTADRSR